MPMVRTIQNCGLEEELLLMPFSMPMAAHFPYADPADIMQNLTEISTNWDGIPA